VALDDKTLREWEAIMRRIESIDARIWQGAGVLLVLSIGGISLLGWNTPETWVDFAVVLFVGVISIAILVVWWFIFHRWIYIQRLSGYRAREIEEVLDIRYNRYAHLLEYWASNRPEIKETKKWLKEKEPDSYNQLESFWRQQKKVRFVHATIRRMLRWLTGILIITWILFVVWYAIAYFTR
jgi:hypothetical protein